MAVREKFAGKVHAKEKNPRGVLTCALDEYEKCLSLTEDRLEELFSFDERKWILNMKSTKEGIDKMTKSLSAFSEE